MATGDVNAPEQHERGYAGNPRDPGEEGDRKRSRRGRRPLPPEILALELEDGRLVADVLEAFGAGIFARSGLRLADGRLAESVIGPAAVPGLGAFGGLGRFGGFRIANQDARVQFALRERMGKERLAALSRLGFGNTILTGPQGVTATAPVRRNSAGPV